MRGKLRLIQYLILFALAVTSTSELLSIMATSDLKFLICIAIVIGIAAYDVRALEVF